MQGWSGGDWGNCSAVRGRPQGGRNVLQGSVSGNTTEWFVDMGPFGRNGK